MPCKAIKHEKWDDLGNVATNKLVLHQVNIVEDEAAIKTVFEAIPKNQLLPETITKNQELLRPLFLLSTYFSADTDENMVYILIRISPSESRDLRPCGHGVVIADDSLIIHCRPVFPSLIIYHSHCPSSMSMSTSTVCVILGPFPPIRHGPPTTLALAATLSSNSTNSTLFPPTTLLCTLPQLCSHTILPHHNIRVRPCARPSCDMLSLAQPWVMAAAAETVV